MENQQHVWAIDPIHTRIRFDAKYLLITSVSGWFRELEGTVICTQPDFSDAEIEVILYTRSIFTGVEQRDQHLLSSDFFNAEHFPTISFRSKKVENQAGIISVTGTLTIKKIDHPILFQATHIATVPDPMGNEKAGFELDAVFNRKDFQISWNQAFGAQGLLISDEVKIHGDVQLLRIR